MQKKQERAIRDLKEQHEKDLENQKEHLNHEKQKELKSLEESKEQ